ncbi:amidohydrolase family protein [Sphingomonas sp. URHD0057]|uniref:amidohydrolase family protein n=1 Tax=Sphingomonas sp. URHD0057 TaxID=1380389 RepID=UPI000564FED5|nr:amidohydrolase family protein [Sphingomonas sp. URHD0057]
MTLRLLTAVAAIALASVGTAAPVLAPPQPLSTDLQRYVRIAPGRIALAHVRVIDGTGAPAAEDQTLLIDGARIAAVQPGSAPVPSGYQALDLTGATVMPGIVGMHNHLFYLQRPNIDASGASEDPLIVPQMSFSAPRLYLANGVTTMRTTGSVEPDTDLNLKREIDAGRLIGPHLDVTGPYLEGEGAFFIQAHTITSPEDARREVAYWAGQGVNSFKAYMHITRAELKAAIDEAHHHHLKVTGHLCSVTYPEAVALGIDNLEHGFFVNTQLDPGKQPDKCSDGAGDPTLLAMKPDSAEANALIKLLVDHHVAITSTLPVFEQGVPLHAPLQARQMNAMSPQAKESYLYLRNLTASGAGTKHGQEEAEKYKNDLGLERQFVAAGGLLIAGPDPTGNGGVIPGFGDQRELELLVEAGFSPVEAIRIGTLNGATYLGLADRIGSIAAGKNADLIVVRGNPAADIRDVEKVDIVFKDGVGFDSAKLLQSVKGHYGQY